VLPWDGKALLANDFTGDGHVDAIIQDTLYRRSLYRGRGDGTFDPPIALSPPPWPVERLASADINADGILDLLMIPQNGGFVAIELGTGGGQFTASTAAQLVTGELETATRFTIGDFNNDGHPDLAVASNTHKVVIELGAADGTFTTGQIIPNLDASDLAAAKLDGDGVVDLVVVGAAGVTSLVGNGDGTFAAPVTLAGSAIGNLVIADFNNDGTPDCAVADQGWTLQAYLGTGTGTFTPVGTAIPTAQFNSSTSGTAELRARDIDGDGHIDLVLGELPSLTILHGGGDGTFAIAHVYAAQARSIGLADADGDGITDVLALGGPMLGVLHGRGDGTFVAPESHHEPDDRGGLFRTSADFDHDGRTDVVIETEQGMNALLAQAGGTLTDAALVAETDTPYDLRAGDVTGDGIADLVGIFPASSGITVRVANGAGDGTFAPFTTFALPTVDSKLLQLADVDRDGKQDLVLSVSAAHPHGPVLVARSLGDGTFGPATGFLGATTWAVAADFDGDGISDLLTTDGGGYSMWIMYGDGTGGFGMPAAGLDGDAGTPPLVADVDRDGRSDVVLPGSDPMLGRTITVMRGLASRTLGPALVTTGVDADAFGASGARAVVDVTGDGVLDLVGLRDTMLVVLPGYGDGYFAKHVSAYPATDDLSNARPAYMEVSDVDLDGRADILFWKGMGVGIALDRGCVP
jgi:hypothetical protein